MFFFLSKLLDALLEPLTWWLLAMLGALVAARRKRTKLAWGLALFGAGALLLCSIPVVANAAVANLESGVGRSARIEPYDAVILLGGAVDYRGLADDEVTFGDNVERLHATFELLKEGRAKVAILSGGAAHERTSEAALLAKVLMRWGVDEGQLLLEPDSLNTHQNAVNVAKLAKEKGYSRLLLVTSAYHMPRALGCFKAEHVDVDGWPVDFRARAPMSVSLWPRAGALEAVSFVLRERAGRLIYRAMGYSRE